MPCDFFSNSFCLTNEDAGAQAPMNRLVHLASLDRILPIKIAHRTTEMVAIHVAVLRTPAVLDTLVTFSGAGKLFLSTFIAFTLVDL